MYSPVTPRDAVNGLGCNAVMRPVNLLIEAALLLTLAGDVGGGGSPK